GMLVDNGIVVVENIFRLREEGLSLREAADRGAAEVTGAITSSTLTTVAVFFPIVFVEGVAGQIFGDFALAVAFSLLGSLITALYLIPMLASRERLFEVSMIAGGDPIWLRRAIEARRGPGAVAADAAAFVRDRYRATTFIPFRDRALAARVALAPLALVVGAWRALLFAAEIPTRLLGAILGAALYGLSVVLGMARVGLGRLLGKIFGGPLRLFGSGFDSMERGYPRLLQWCLRRRATVLITVGLLFGASAALFPTLGQELIPRMHQGEFGVILEKPIGTPLDVTAASVLPAERMLAANPDLESVFAEIGATGSTGTQQRELQGEHRAELTLRIARPDQNVYREENIITRVRAGLQALGGMTLQIVEPSIFSFKTPIEVEIEGRDLETLKRLGRDVKRVLERVAGLEDIQLSLQDGSPEVHVAFDDERMSHYGLSLSNAAESLRDKILGAVPTKFTKGERKIDIRVRARTEELKSIEALRDLTIGYIDGQPVPLRAVSDITVRPGPSEIRRIGQRRVAVLSANVHGRDLGGVSDEINAALRAESRKWPGGYGFTMGGQEREWKTSYRSLQLAFALAVFLVYIVMASQFESLFEPFVIMFSVPLASIGVVFTMKVLGLNVSVISLIGVIMLAGIVVNNAIVLVDRVKQVRAEGANLGRALDTAGRQRLRPILMTTTTTVLGLIPMAVSVGDGAEIRAPMAIVVIAGLTTSTILTLFIVPIIYSYMTRRTGPQDVLFEEEVAIEGAAELPRGAVT
ncbi:MAG: efflux RND transporter permease subunit, partial [Myxococcales bacterium]|nr:efflux RND transporter permease subunit [Myxococcales bacterium]